MVNVTKNTNSFRPCTFPAAMAETIRGIRFIMRHAFGNPTCHKKYFLAGEVCANTSQSIKEAASSVRAVIERRKMFFRDINT